MKLIKEKKIKEFILTIVLYITFCASYWYTSRGGLALSILQMPLAYQNAFLSNDIVAFFTAGLIPLIFYELISRFAFKTLQYKMGAVSDNMRYALKYFYIMANIVVFLVKLVYFITPIASIYGNIFIEFVVTTGFFVWYLFYVCKNYIDKTRVGAVLAQIGGTYLVLYASLLVITLLLEAFI